MTVLIQDLTSIVKEQKAKIAELVKSNQETTANLKVLLSEHFKYISIWVELFLFILIFYLKCNHSIPGKFTERCIFPFALKQSNPHQLLFLYLLLISYKRYVVYTAKSRVIPVFRESALFALWALVACIWSGGCSELKFKNIHFPDLL